MIFTAPDYKWLKYDHLPKLFLAGSITGAEDWQSGTAKMIDSPNIVILNPRRKGLIDLRGDIAKEQIEWEHDALSDADGVLFWFPPVALGMITLFELGKELGRKNKTLFVGAHPEYIRVEDVNIQCELEGQKVYDNLTDLINCVNYAY